MQWRYDYPFTLERADNGGWAISQKSNYERDLITAYFTEPDEILAFLADLMAKAAEAG